MTEHTPLTNDVRMRGFARRDSVERAWQWLDGHAARLGSERVCLIAAHGRVLAESISATIDVPAFDRSAMDGYALRGAETVGSGDYNSLCFRLLGESLPGRRFRGEVSAGTAVRIMTGAPVPAGADAVVPAEYASESSGEVEITVAVPVGKNIGRQGEDIAAGTCILNELRVLRPQDVGLLASVGIDSVPVVRRPRVRVVVTGDELVAPGGARGADQVYESNGSMLHGLVERDGGVVESVLHIRDDRDAIREAIVTPGADVMIVSGGSSVGAEDHAPGIVAEAGELAIHGIAMRPSSPAGPLATMLR